MESLLCTVADTAALLRVSVDTIRRSIRAGVIPVKRLRSNIRVSRTWIEAYVAETAPMLLSRHQVAVKLGISVRSLRTLQSKGLLPTVNLGGLHRIAASAVNEYVKRSSFGFLRSKPAPSGGARPASAPPSGSHPVSVRRTGFSNVRGV